MRFSPISSARSLRSLCFSSTSFNRVLNSANSELIGSWVCSAGIFSLLLFGKVKGV